MLKRHAMHYPVKQPHKTNSEKNLSLEIFEMWLSKTLDIKNRKNNLGLDSSKDLFY